MDVGAVGGAMGGAGMCAGMGMAPATGGLQAASAPQIEGTQLGAIGSAACSPGNLNGASNPAVLSGLTPQLQSLVQSLKDFSSAEILIALMLMKAADSQHCHKGNDSSAALSLLAGLGLASQFGHMNLGLSANLSASPCGMSGSMPSGGVGLQLNVTV